MPFDVYTHGLWLVGGVFIFIAAFITGNIEFVEGTTEVSFWLSIALSFALFLIAGMAWISAAVNARK